MATITSVITGITLTIYYVCAHLTTHEQVFQPGNGNTFKFGAARPTRYLLYDVNPGEGFNLRRDVYMRVANLVKLLNEDDPWALVLPPWGRLYHWKSRQDQSQIRWSTFFHLPALNRHVPVIEFEDYLKVRGEPVIDEIYYVQRYKEGWSNGSSLFLAHLGFAQWAIAIAPPSSSYSAALAVRGEPVIDEIYYLQRYKEGWSNGRWEEKMDERPCLDTTGYEKDVDEQWRAWFWGYEEVVGKQFKCLSVQAESSSMKPFLNKNTTGSCVLLVRAEQLIHGQYSEWSREYWTARRSMVFAKHLRDVGDAFRREELESTDEADNTVWDNDWTQMERHHGEASGGPYVAVHMRRRDFLYGHDEDVPSIAGAATQLRAALNANNLTTLFVATDAPREEYDELKGLLEEFKVTRYEPSPEVHNKYMDGGVAIIDQWIAAHARFFLGTSVSTFSFRIHEEREILGFASSMTFNRLCGDAQGKCEQPTKWTIKY